MSEPEGKPLTKETVKVCYVKDGKRHCNEVPEPVVFTQPGCVWCSSTLGHLRGRGVKFKQVQVVNQKTFNKMMKISGQQGTPVTVIGDKVIVGHNPRAIDKVLGIKR